VRHRQDSRRNTGAGWAIWWYGGEGDGMVMRRELRRTDEAETTRHNPRHDTIQDTTPHGTTNEKTNCNVNIKTI
jgi:hypothetical protein